MDELVVPKKANIIDSNHLKEALERVCGKNNCVRSASSDTNERDHLFKIDINELKINYRYFILMLFQFEIELVDRLNSILIFGV